MCSLQDCQSREGGGAGGPWPTQILVDQLTLSLGAGYFSNSTTCPHATAFLRHWLGKHSGRYCHCGTRIKFWSFKLSIELLLI
jgi:hypothetical protein